MRTVLAGCLALGLVGCVEDWLDDLSSSGVCDAEGPDGGSLCYEAMDGGNAVKRHCDEESSTFVEGTTCEELGFTELCSEADGTMVFGDSTETCAAFRGDTETN